MPSEMALICSEKVKEMELELEWDMASWKQLESKLIGHVCVEEIYNVL